MMLPQLLAVTLALAATPQLVSAAIFPKGTKVKMIDAKGFREAMNQNMTSAVAFVAPWCGHCQKMAPEYSRAALGLYPLIPLYAVDCDVAKNKKLCADQGVQGFPTIKLYPRGKSMQSSEFNGPERSASAFFYWASRAVPHKIKKTVSLDDVSKWAKQEVTKPRALLLKKGSKMPLLWSVLANKYRDDIAFSSHRDRRGKSSIKLGFEAGEDRVSKVVVYPVGETRPVLYEGIMKFDSISKFFDSVLDGTADLKTANAEAAAEEFIPDPEDLETEKEQEAEMLKLAHGGYAEMIDFEKAIKEGHGKDFHAANGYPGMMPGAKVPYMKDQAAGGSQGGIVESSKAQGEVPTPTKGATPMTDAAGQIVFDPKAETETGQPRTPVVAPTQSESVPEETPVTETAPSEDISTEDPELDAAEEDDVEAPAAFAAEEAVEEAVPETAEEEAAPTAEETHVKDEL